MSLRFVLGLPILLIVAGCAAGSADPVDAIDDEVLAVTAAPQRLPSFARMWGAFPFGEAEEVKARIGGSVDADWITNICVIRTSRALNYSGAPVPRGPAPSAAGLHTVKGADGKNYGFRVSEFRRYMLRTYGAPTLARQNPNGIIGLSSADFIGRKGVILFDVRIWSDSTGHADLWNGFRPGSEEYFDVASGVQLWEVE